MENDAQAEPTAATAAQQKPETVEEITDDLADSVTPVLDLLTEGYDRMEAQLTSRWGLIQAAVILGGFVIAYLLARPLKARLAELWPSRPDDGAIVENARRVALRMVLPVIWVVALWVSLPIMRQFWVGADMIRIAASLLQAWILIGLFSMLVRNAFWSRVFATFAWAVAALYIVHLLNPLIALLESVSMTFGEAQLSLFDVIKGTVLLILLIWFASLFARFVQLRLSRSQTLSPSVRSLIGQAVRIGTLFLAIVVALNAIGIDLTALAVFSGAVGVGIGFGLQAIFSNLMSGVIILLEGSVKVGDFVELQSGVTGEVREINTRATLITTNDNVDILVPNSEFINAEVTNWTHRESYRRQRVPFGVAYGTDKELVRKAALEAAASVPHQLSGPFAREPEVWLVNFGESSLDFELVVWLSPEAVKRPARVMADYNWALETALGKYGIEIPFPQRDLHLRSGSLPVRMEPPQAEA